jgi:hypothetical protein
MNSFTFLFKAMKETHEQHKTKIDIDKFRSGTTNITQNTVLLKKSACGYILYLLMSYVLAERVEYTEDTFCERVIGNLRAGWVVLWVLRVPWCHARKFDALNRITFPDLQQLLVA